MISMSDISSMADLDVATSQIGQEINLNQIGQVSFLRGFL